MLLSLDGLSLGDCFGERFFGPSDEVVPRIIEQQLPDGPWPYTDDTEMALSLCEVVAAHDGVAQDELARLFAQRMAVARGYGSGAYDILMGIRAGGHWHGLAAGGFRGMGSFGNGAAMRVAPLGAYFAEGPRDRLVEQARLSAEVTHLHPEGIAGAIAVAVATAEAWDAQGRALGNAWIERTLELVPKGFTHDAIREALAIPATADCVTAAKALGNGSGITAPDTVPFCLWNVAHTDDFVEAMWKTVGALGDRDTTCAIVGGIMAPRIGRAALPVEWLARREPFEVPWSAAPDR